MDLYVSYAFQSYITLFTSTTNLASALKLWDIIVQKGISTVPLMLALILSHYQLKYKNFEQLVVLAQFFE